MLPSLNFLFHVKHRPSDLAALVSASEALGVRLEPSQAELLLRFERLLADRAIAFGMISSADAPRLRERHILDSLRAAAEVADAGSAYDLGSGAGLPGLVVAIALPGLRVGLIESRRRRASFLEQVVADLGVPNAAVIGGQVQGVSDRVDACFARAFAPIAAAWAAAEGLLVPSGRLVYFAGVRAILEAPAGARILAVRPTLVLESAGPLVIMGRQ